MHEGVVSARAPNEILLIEDNPHDIEITLLAFRKHKIEGRIQVVRDGEEALDYLFCTGQYADKDPNAPRPKLILLDLKLPLVDGIEVLRRVKSDPRTRRTPVVVLSSSREDKDVVTSYRLGANSYLVKPLNFEEFNQMSSVLAPYWTQLNQQPQN